MENCRSGIGDWVRPFLTPWLSQSPNLSGLGLLTCKKKKKKECQTCSFGVIAKSKEVMGVFVNGMSRQTRGVQEALENYLGRLRPRPARLLA